MANTNENSDLLLAVVDDFVARHHQGEQPGIEEYCQRYPTLADEIRELFPALELLEDLQPATDDAAADPIGGTRCPERIGDYEIIAEIGRGGMGIVYEAEQESLGRRVALKILPQSSRIGNVARVRFQREARAAAQLHHTNIVPVFDVGQEDGLFFYAMQLIQGQSLDRVIQELASAGSASKAETPGAGSSGNPHASTTQIPAHSTR